MSSTTFTETLQAEVATLQAKHPILAGALDKAFALVVNGAVFPLEDGRTAHVRSQRDPDTAYLVNGSCTCPSAQYRTAPCAHRLAFRVYQRTVERLTGDPEERWEPVATETASAPPRRTIPAKYIQKLQGKDFVRFAGLLQMAQAEGLVELSAVWTHNEAELSLAHAVAIFEDGRRYEESGDSTPQNAKNIGLHWRRMSLTRAKARALRDALGVEECSVEEMGEAVAS